MFPSKPSERELTNIVPIFTNSSDTSFVPEDNDDGFSLGKHLIECHNLKKRENFNQSYKVSILCNSSPRTLEVDKHRFIQRLRTLRPLGLNAVDPFGIPLLDFS